MLSATQPSEAPTWTARGRGADSQPHVLVVEDSPSDMFLIGRALAGTVLSLRCQFSTTLAEAVTLATRDAPDIVLLDLSLPDSHGIRTLKHFKNACPDAPVVVVTGRCELGLATHSLRAGARDYLIKTELGTLEPTVRRVLAETSLEREQQRREASRITTLRLESAGRVAAGVAHEINTPLQFVGDNLAFLRRAVQLVTPALGGLSHSSGEDPARHLSPVDREKLAFVVEQMPEAIEQAIEGVQRIARLTAALRAQHELSPEAATRVELPLLIDTALAHCRRQFPLGMQARAHYAPGLPAIAAHDHALSSAFSNIIDNAREAIAGSGRPHGTLEISVCQRDENIEVRFTDDGPGIEAEHLGNIFDPFYTTKAVGGGTGQGLAFAYHVIVRQHGGELSVQSVLGRGATFIASLPIVLLEHGVEP